MPRNLQRIVPGTCSLLGCLLLFRRWTERSGVSLRYEHIEITGRDIIGPGSRVPSLQPHELKTLANIFV